MAFLQNSGGGELMASAHHRRSFGEMAKFSFAYEVILKETQPKVGLSKSSGSDQKQTLVKAFMYVYVTSRRAGGNR